MKGPEQSRDHVKTGSSVADSSLLDQHEWLGVSVCTVLQHWVGDIAG